MSSRSVERPPRDLVTEARAIAARDNVRNVGHLAADLAVAGAAIGLGPFSGHVLGYLLGIVLIGTRMRAVANLMHEASHYKLFRCRWWNNAVGHLCATLIAESLTTYTREHQIHHRLLWRDHRDPDWHLYRVTGTEVECASRMPFPAFLVRHVLLVLLLVQPARRILTDRYLTRRAVVVLGVVGLAWLCAPGLGAALLLFWCLPWFTAYQAISYWAELGEHGGLRLMGWGWGSRNWRGGALTRWVIGSHSADPYHLAHHWFPAVPHYRLAELDRACRRLWPDYVANDRCGGFFRAGRDGRRSVLADVWRGGATTAMSVPGSLVGGRPT